MSLDEVVDLLEERYGTDLVDLYYHDQPDATESVPEELQETTHASHYRAQVNPAWLGDPDTDALWSIVTEGYTTVTPDEKYGPLLDVLDHRDLMSGVEGTARLYRRGGEVHADIFLGDYTFTHDETEKEWTLGFQTGYDYYKGHALYAEVIARDEDRGTVLRQLGDRHSRRHTGMAATDVAEWWDDLLDTLDTATDDLRQAIAVAMGHIIDFQEYPTDTRGFIESLWSHASLSKAADQNLPTHVSHDTGTFSAWEVAEAMMDAIKDDYEAKPDHSAIRQKNRAVNTLLFSPALAEQQAIESIREDLEHLSTLEGTHEAHERLNERQGAIGAAAEKYTDTKNYLKRVIGGDDGE